MHDPAKVVLDLAVTLALGGNCLADVALLRAEPGVQGPVASDPTVSRTITALAKDAPAALQAINTTRAGARRRAWALTGQHAPDDTIDATCPLIIDLDATLLAARSDKEPTTSPWSATRCANRPGTGPAHGRAAGAHPHRRRRRHPRLRGLAERAAAVLLGSGSPPGTPPLTCCGASRSGCGRRRTTPRTRSVTAPGSRS